MPTARTRRCASLSPVVVPVEPEPQAAPVGVRLGAAAVAPPSARPWSHRRCAFLRVTWEPPPLRLPPRGLGAALGPRGSHAAAATAPPSTLPGSAVSCRCLREMRARQERDEEGTGWLREREEMGWGSMTTWTNQTPGCRSVTWMFAERAEKHSTNSSLPSIFFYTRQKKIMYLKNFKISKTIPNIIKFWYGTIYMIYYLYKII